MEQDSSDKLCGICGNDKFVEHNTRPNACCSNCRSLERTRLLWMVLNKEIELRSDMRVLHFAPELSIGTRLHETLGENYMPCDVHPPTYKKFPCAVVKVNMCYLHRLPPDTFDLIIHNHVLEHIPCSVTQALHNLARLLKPGGIQLFSVPFRGDETREYLGDDMDEETRIKEFGQADHMRLFGRRDFLVTLESTYGEDFAYDMVQAFNEEELERNGIPAHVLKTIGGETIFKYRRPINQIFET